MFLKFLLKLFIFFISPFLMLNQSYAQWVFLGAAGYTINSITSSGTKIGIATIQGAIITNDLGVNWIYNSNLSFYEVNTVVISANNFYAGTTANGVFSSSNGVNWTALNNGLLTDSAISTIVIDNNNFYAGTAGRGIYYSSNNGTNWTSINNGLTSLSITSLAIKNNYLFAGTSNNGVFLSTNNGVSWNAISNGISSNAKIKSITICGNSIFAINEGNLIKSDNNGTNWSFLNGLNGKYVTALHVVNTTLIIGTVNNGTYLSSDYGLSWISINDGYTNYRISDIAHNQDYLYLSSLDCGVWYRPVHQVVAVNNFKNNEFNVLVFPNPFNIETNLNYYLHQKEDVSLCIFNLSGNKIAEFINSKQEKGEHSFKINFENIASGIYYYRLTIGNKIIINKISCLK